MPSLSALTDTTALKHRYVRKVFVYVEADSDVHLFQTIMGPGFNEFIEFHTPSEKGKGCGPAKAYVAKYRKDNPRIFALLDGEAAVPEADGFEHFVKSDATIFTMVVPEGILYLADHEAENVLLRQTDLIAYIADQTTLADMGKHKTQDIALKVSSIVERQFAAAFVNTQVVSFTPKARSRAYSVAPTRRKFPTTKCSNSSKIGLRRGTAVGRSSAQNSNECASASS